MSCYVPLRGLARGCTTRWGVFGDRGALRVALVGDWFRGRAGRGGPAQATGGGGPMIVGPRLRGLWQRGVLICPGVKPASRMQSSVGRFAVAADEQPVEASHPVLQAGPGGVAGPAHAR